MSNPPKMNKYYAILLMLVCHAIGIGIGIGGTYWFLSHWTDKLIVSSAAANSGSRVQVLQRVRSGQTNSAIELEEILLDGDIITLSYHLSSRSPSERDPRYVRALQRAQAYRAKFPYTNRYPDINQGVSNAFNLVPSTEK